jgi:hypothetical protein
MKRIHFPCLIGFFSILLFAPQVFSLDLYDDFSSPLIDINKWRVGESVTEIDPMTQKLISAVASPNPAVITSYPYRTDSTLAFADPNSIFSMQADVTIIESLINGQGHTRAALAGHWYNDGSPGGGYIGDIWAEVSIRHFPSGPKGTWSICRYTNSQGTTYECVGGDFATGVNIGTTYTLKIQYSIADLLFSFWIGSERKDFDMSSYPPPAGNPNNPYKYFKTRVWLDGAGSSGYINATLDNVYKNDSLYEVFSSPVIDATKWITYEFVREVSGGEFRSKIRSSSASNATIANQLEFVNPSAIKEFEAKVTPLIFQNTEGADIAAALQGFFFNDGTPGGGPGHYLGEVGAGIYIGGTEADPAAYWSVWTYEEDSSQNPQVLAEGTFPTPITLGNTYVLFLGWNGSQFTFKIGDEIANFEPGGTINPSNRPWKALRNRIWEATGQEAIMEVLFDDVKVKYSLSGDFAPADCDVDGSDLAALIADPLLLDLPTFAQNFGRNSCP